MLHWKESEKEIIKHRVCPGTELVWALVCPGTGLSGTGLSGTGLSGHWFVRALVCPCTGLSGHWFVRALSLSGH